MVLTSPCDHMVLGAPLSAGPTPEMSTSSRSSAVSPSASCWMVSAARSASRSAQPRVHSCLEREEKE
ncbi:mCG1051017 [Mus musculus]|nr:mCG1051017 [Mus musculus]